ncbi:MAG: hypothetical protein K2N87_00115 [Eubacterium sp.]|nr:hypothetical protein [Eubacterium sp.]
MQYEHGTRIQSTVEPVSGYPDPAYGKLVFIQFMPLTEEELAGLLRKEQEERKRFKEGDAGAYIESL